MDKEKLLFYNEYEMFYKMTDKSEVFREYCEKHLEQIFLKMVLVIYLNLKKYLTWFH